MTLSFHRADNPEKKIGEQGKTLRPPLAKSSGGYIPSARIGRAVGRDLGAHVGVPVDDGFWYTNTVENYFSIFKRGVNGIYQHISQKHLKRYLSEFDFRYNTRDLEDHERATQALKGITGKRLTYRRIGFRPAS